jgi:hypothetical protein
MQQARLSMGTFVLETTYRRLIGLLEALFVRATNDGRDDGIY